MKATRLFILTIFLGFIVKQTIAQTNTVIPNPNKYNHFSMGFQISQYQKDYGIGFNFTSHISLSEWLSD